LCRERNNRNETSACCARNNFFSEHLFLLWWWWFWLSEGDALQVNGMEAKNQLLQPYDEIVTIR